MSKLTIVEGNSNNKDNVRVIMVKGEKGDKGDNGEITYNDVVDNLTSTETQKPLSANQGRVLKNLVNENTNNITMETNERSSADLNLQTQITEEATIRTNADNNLQTQITEEATTRTSADNNLQSQISSLASGSPLSASSVSGMTDTTKIYVNTSDGNWYYYNGSNWVVGGVYQATVDSDSLNMVINDTDNLYYNSDINVGKVNEYSESNITDVDKKLPFKFKSNKYYLIVTDNGQTTKTDSLTSYALQFYKGETTTDIRRDRGSQPERNNLQFIYYCLLDEEYDGVRLVVHSETETNVNFRIEELSYETLLIDEFVKTDNTTNFIFPFSFLKGRKYDINIIKEFRVNASNYVIKLLKNTSDLSTNIQTLFSTSGAGTQAQLANQTFNLNFRTNDNYNYICFSSDNYGTRNIQNRDYFYAGLYLTKTLKEIEYEYASYAVSELSIETYENTYTGQKIDINKNKFNYNVDFSLLNYDNHSVQGLAIYNKYAFQTRDKGYCQIYDLDTKELVNQFALGSNVSTNHCGNANFGVEFPNGNTSFPALYVSGDLTEYCCYVENITLTGSQLIQKLDFKFLINSGYGNATFIDKLNNKLYCMQRINTNIFATDNTMRVYEFNLPSLSDGDDVDGIKVVTFANSDILRTFDLPVWQRGYQDGVIINGKLFQTSGGGSNNKTLINVYDLEKNTLDSSIDITTLSNSTEPEGIDTYNNCLYVSFINNNLVKLNFK